MVNAADLLPLEDATSRNDWDRVRIIATRLLSADAGNATSHLALARVYRARGEDLSAALHAFIAWEINGSVDSKTLLNDCSERVHFVADGDSTLPLGRAYLWEHYERTVRRVRGLKSEISERFEQNGYERGYLPDAIAARIHCTLKDASPRLFHSRDSTPGFVCFNFSAEQEHAFNAASKFREIEGACASALSDVFASLKADVAQSTLSTLPQ